MSEKKGLGKHSLVYNKVVPKFLQQHLDKEQLVEKQREAKIQDRPDNEEEQPVVVADEELKKRFEEEQQTEHKRVEEAIDKSNKNIEIQQAIEKSKFDINEETAHVFHAHKEESSERKEKYGLGSRKRKTSHVVDHLKNKKPKTAGETKGKNTSLLSFDPDEV
eukprot:TRINITY_DN3532_c0_g1_i2.p1 TRINITY_DN3532_c0_g1~~TRINITY_DN3532_c0_g1_i2.p1  ORF type:complete len:163 (+),score=60.81 TRINITY_DN3532_c0_g1_i2:92-580(+)